MPELVQDLGVTSDSPELLLDADVLREVNSTLRPAAIEFETAIKDALQLSDTRVEEVSVDIELPTNLAGPAGKALRAVDVAWRLAYVFSELDEGRLDGSGELSLDDLAPVEHCGLAVVDVQIGSLDVKLKAVDVLVRRISPYLGVVAAITTIVVNADRAVAAIHPAAPPTRIEMPAPSHDPIPRFIGNHPGLPPGAMVKVKVKFPKDRSLLWPSTDLS
jgi:hypothetical protein